VPVSRRNAATVAIQEFQRLNVAQTTAAGMTRFPTLSGVPLDQVSHLTDRNNTLNNGSGVHYILAGGYKKLSYRRETARQLCMSF